MKKNRLIIILSFVLLLALILYKTINFDVKSVKTKPHRKEETKISKEEEKKIKPILPPTLTKNQRGWKSSSLEEKFTEKTWDKYKTNRYG